MTPEETLTLIGVLASAYPQWGSKALRPDSVKVWASVLSGDKFEWLKLAAEAHIRESEYPPTVAGLLKRTPGSSAHAGTRAWSEVEEAYQALPWRTPPGCSAQPPLEPEWKHATTHEALKALGGWTELYQRRASGDGHAPSERKAFLETFEAFKAYDGPVLLDGAPQLEEG